MILAEGGYQIAASDLQAPEQTVEISDRTAYNASKHSLVGLSRTLAAEWSGFVNGHTLSADGGWFGDGSWESLRRGMQGSL